MDWGMLLASVGLSLVLTVFGYLLVPTILALTGKKYEAKKLKRINIINCVVVWLLFRILQISLGDDPSSGAAVFLWGAVGHWILKKYCLKEAQPAPQPKPQPVRTTTPAYSQPVKYCSYCGQAINPVTKKCNGCGKQYFKGISWKAVLTTMVIVLFVVSFAGNIVLCFKNVELNKAFIEAQNNADTLSSLQKSNTDLKEEIAELERKISDLEEENKQYYDYWVDSFNEIAFYDEHIVFVADNGTNLYHKYDCSIFQNSESFWAYNTEAAEYEGYRPCSNCCD